MTVKNENLELFPQPTQEVIEIDTGAIGRSGEIRNRDYDPTREISEAAADQGVLGPVVERQVEQSSGIPIDAVAGIAKFRADMEAKRQSGQAKPKDQVARDDGGFMATGIYVAKRGGPFHSQK